MKVQYSSTLQLGLNAWWHQFENKTLCMTYICMQQTAHSVRCLQFPLNPKVKLRNFNNPIWMLSWSALLYICKKHEHAADYSERLLSFLLYCIFITSKSVSQVIVANIKLIFVISLNPWKLNHNDFKLWL